MSTPKEIQDAHLVELKSRLQAIKDTAHDGMINPQVAPQRMCECFFYLIDGVQWFMTKAEADEL